MRNKIFFAWCGAIFLCGVLLFVFGFHDIDTAMNMKPNSIDYGLIREPVAMQTLYLGGVLKLGLSLVCFLLSNGLILFRFLTKEIDK